MPCFQISVAYDDSPPIKRKPRKKLVQNEPAQQAKDVNRRTRKLSLYNLASPRSTSEVTKKRRNSKVYHSAENLTETKDDTELKVSFFLTAEELDSPDNLVMISVKSQ